MEVAKKTHKTSYTQSRLMSVTLLMFLVFRTNYRQEVKDKRMAINKQEQGMGERSESTYYCMLKGERVGLPVCHADQQGVGLEQ